MSLIDEGKYDEETQQALDYLYSHTTGLLARVGASVTVFTHKSGWAEETARVFVDVGEVVGDSILGG